MTLDSLNFNHKTFRDAVHGDIAFSELEVAIIDAEQFQRLRFVKQLGTTYLLYHSAEHSRYTHALGTTYVADAMVAALRKNGYPISVEDQRLVRLCALLHDIGHLPFGHTLEDEAHILTGDDEHDSAATFEAMLGSGTAIGDLIMTAVSEECRADVVRVLSSGGLDGVASLGDRAWIADVVGNTLCADLLDYLLRDIRMCGLRGGFDERIFAYLTLDDYQGAKRVVLRLTKGGDVRRDMVNELINLLSLRYSLAERVYYHHHKMFTSGMVSRAVQEGLLGVNSGNRRAWLEKFGDESLLRALADQTESEGARRLASALLKRKTYRAAYKLTYREARLERGEGDRIRVWAERYNEHPEERLNTELRLEMYNGLPPGSVVIYCPNLKMQQKIAEVLVRREGGNGSATVLQFHEIQDRAFSAKIRQIVEDHERLWKAYVLVDSEQVQARPDLLKTVASDCEREFHLLSEFEGLSDLRLPSWIERRIDEWDISGNKRVTFQERQALAAASSRPTPGQRDVIRPTDEELEQRLVALRRQRLL